jgi:hypothetical protein
MGTTQSICCRDTIIAHISEGISFQTYVDWDRFAHLKEYYASYKPVTLLQQPPERGIEGCYMNEKFKWVMKEAIVF